jgi:hypothetical protein
MCTARTFLILRVTVVCVSVCVCVCVCVCVRARVCVCGTDVQSGDLLPRCKLPNIDSFKESTKEWVAKLGMTRYIDTSLSGLIKLV